MPPCLNADVRDFRHPRGQLTGYIAGAAAAGLAFGLLVYRLGVLQKSDGWPQHDPTSVWTIIALRALAFALFLLFVWLGYLGITGFVHNLVVKYRIDETGIRKCSWRKSEQVPWSRVSGFSETDPTHREGDQFCYLKGHNGEVLMRVGAHVIGDDGPRLLAAVRRHVGPPRIEEGRAPEIFRFGDFGETPPFHIALDLEEVAAVSSVGEMRLRLADIDRIQIRAWPETGTGMERARMIAGDRMIEFDSRLIGFWPLMDYVVERARHAEVDDRSRRARLARGSTRKTT